MKKLILILLILFIGSVAHAQNFVEASGESVILNNDVSKAKTEAVLRAKWNAAESVLGVKVKAQSVVQNFALVDEMIQKSVSGYVESFKILSENQDGDLYKVRISAKVVKEGAEKALSSLIRVSSAAVLVPAIHLDGSIDETNVFSETLIGKMADQGYTVVDVASIDPGHARELEQSLKKNDFLFARSMMLKSLSNLIVLGKLDFTVSTKKGEDAGYGLSMPFNVVTARLNYKIITASDKKILTAGSVEAKGKALNEKDAAAIAMKDLAEKVAPEMLNVLGKYMAGSTKKVKVVFENLGSLGETFGMKEMLQNLAWVKSVEEIKMGEFTVEYPENTIYLANSITQNPGYKIRDFSAYSIFVRVDK